MKKDVRLVLGTAQLGMNYGIANRSGRPDVATAKAIIQEAWDNGVREFDTASAYGESESVLGGCLTDLRIGYQAKIITKIAPDINRFSKDAVFRAVDSSLRNLGIDRLYGLLLHNEQLLDSWNAGIGDALYELVVQQRVEHLGASVYAVDRAIQALATEHIDIVQLPSNMLDRRFERAGVFRQAAANGKQIQVRSVFLQGLLLMDAKDCPASLQHVAVPVLKKLNGISERHAISKHELALGYAKAAYPNAKILFGAETQQQVKENIASWRKDLSKELIAHVQEEFSDVPENLINPALWPK